jgi:hypothetical protein
MSGYLPKQQHGDVTWQEIAEILAARPGPTAAARCEELRQTEQQPEDDR